MLKIEEINQLEKIVRQAGEILKNSKPTVMNYKTNNDLLTKNDVEIEAFLIKEIQEVLPNAAIISEESKDNDLTEANTIVIDPVDGTCNFVMGLATFGVQIAYFEEKECQMSMIYLPCLDEFYLAILGQGAYLNGKRIFLQKEYSHAQGFLLLSDYYQGQEVTMDEQFKLVQKLQPYFLKTRHYGSACIDFTSLVKSSAVAYITYYHKLWDIAPGLLLVKEANGVCGYLAHSDFDYNYKGLVVANNEENLKFILNQFSQIRKS